MARMIPDLLTENSPPGEKRLFQMLKKSPETEDWIVLHSLGLSEHPKQFEGEADFVVIVPELGVLVIEVKSHSVVSRFDGIWLFGRRREPGKDPYKQVSQAMYAIRNYITQMLKVDGIPFSKLVWFTHTHLDGGFRRNVEWKPYEVLDASNMDDPISAIRHSMMRSNRELGHRVRAGKEGFPLRLARKVSDYLRPNFETVAAVDLLRKDREQELLILLEEQYRALDGMADNPRVIFEGAAGTGKTLLAVEAARRAALADERVGLLCYNSKLAEYLRSTLDGDSVDVKTIHQLLREVAGEKVPTNSGRKYWTETLPDLALDRLASGSPFKRYDKLIIDEAQDFDAEGYLMVLDAVLQNGTSDGMIYCFGDFQNQAIFAKGEPKELWKQMLGNPAAFTLSTNCRNLPRIGHQVDQLTPVRFRSISFRRDDDHVDPTLLPYKSGAEQEIRVKKAIETFIKEGYKPSEIVLLSPIRNESFGATHSQIGEFAIQPFGSTSERSRALRWSTIQSFKGLESPAVIVTDIDDRLNPHVSELLYTGLTRARDRLAIAGEARTMFRLYDL